MKPIKIGHRIRITDEVSIEILDIQLWDWLAPYEADITECNLRPYIEYKLIYTDGEDKAESSNLDGLIRSIKLTRENSNEKED